MPSETTPARVLNGRVAVDSLNPLIETAAAAAGDTMTIDLTGQPRMTASAFDELIEACRTALEDHGKANTDIDLISVPVRLRKTHRQIAARHDRTIEKLDDRNWRLQQR